VTIAILALFRKDNHFSALKAEKIATLGQPLITGHNLSLLFWLLKNKKLAF
jgi:hypothetical protein